MALFSDPFEKKIFFFLFNSSQEHLQLSLTHTKLALGGQEKKSAEFLPYLMHFFRNICELGLLGFKLSSIINKEHSNIAEIFNLLTSPRMVKFLPLVSDQYGFPWKTSLSIPDDSIRLFRRDLCIDLNLSNEKLLKNLKKVQGGIPLLNGFEILDEKKIYPPESWFSELFESSFTQDAKSKTGTYYTPPDICDFLSIQAIIPIIFPLESDVGKWGGVQNLAQQLQTSFLSTHYTPIEAVKELKRVLRALREISILDPAVGSGNFLVSSLRILGEIFGWLWKMSQSMNLKTENSLQQIDWGKENFSSFLELKSQKQAEAFGIRLLMDSFTFCGIDLNPYSVIITKLRIFLSLYESGKEGLESEPFFSIPMIKVVMGNSLLDIPAIFPTSGQNFPQFDIILGNPPYGNLLSREEKDKISEECTYPNEISSAFIERGLNLNKPGGNLIFLTSYTICYNKDLSRCRSKLVNNYDLVKIASFDRDRCRLFPKMTQSVSFLQCYRKRNQKSEFILDLEHNKGEILTTNMYRHRVALTDLGFQKANDYLLGGKIGVNFEKIHRLPKIGQQSILDFLSHLKNISETSAKCKYHDSYHILANLKIIKSEKEYSLLSPSKLTEGSSFWVRISGNYWYNAWNRPPYFGTQIALVSLTTGCNFYRPFYICLINSSFYYLWFRIYSDGRHMNSDILKGLPLPRNHPSVMKKFSPLFIIIQGELMERLFAHYDRDRQRFLTSEVKAFLDVVDLAIGYVYEISPPLLEFVLNFEAGIRGGKKMPSAHRTAVLSLLDQIPKDPGAPIPDELLQKFKMELASF